MLFQLPLKSPFKFSWLDSERAMLEIPRVSPFFTGHFPGRPILPGMMVIEASSEFILSNPDFVRASLKLKRVGNAKFSSPVLPGMKVRLEGKRVGESWNVRWFDAATDTEIVVLSVAFG